MSVALVALLLVAVALAATHFLRDRPVAALSVISAAMLVVFLVQAQVLWPWQKETTQRFRAGYPSSMSWIDDKDVGDVGRMIVIDNPTRAEMTQFFNRDIDRVYTPADGQFFGRRISGRQCGWSVNTAGAVDWGAGCGAAPKHLLLDNDYRKLTFAGQRVLAQHAGVGRLVELGANPRLKAVMGVPCQPVVPETEKGGHGREKPADPACFDQIAGAFWLDAPGHLVLRFRGGSKPQQVAFADGSREWRRYPSAARDDAARPDRTGLHAVRRAARLAEGRTGVPGADVRAARRGRRHLHRAPVLTFVRWSPWAGRRAPRDDRARRR